jgi:hypothetical protein
LISSQKKERTSKRVRSFDEYAEVVIVDWPKPAQITDYTLFRFSSSENDSRRGMNEKDSDEKLKSSCGLDQHRRGAWFCCCFLIDFSPIPKSPLIPVKPE